MDSIQMEVRKLFYEGLCCAQVIVKLGLTAKDLENDTLLDCVSGLCNGMFSGNNCGILTGAALMLCLFDRENAIRFMIPELNEWFLETFGSVDCQQLLGDKVDNRKEQCMRMTEDTAAKCQELLSEFGFSLDGSL